MKKCSLLLFLILTTASAVFTQQIKVYRMGEGQLKSAEDLYFYTLPRTSIVFKVTTKRVTTLAGPYAAYAEELLGIQGVPFNNTTEWKIDSIGISSVNEADPDCWYAVKSSRKISPDEFLSFTDQGLIFSPSKSELPLSPGISLSVRDSHNELYYTDLSKTNFYASTADTFYKTILKDSFFVKIPVVRQKVEVRSARERAKDVADLIMKIRQGRFDAVMPEEGSLPEARAFAIALDQMNRMEQNYLSLFIGKKIVNTFTTWFAYAPPANSKETQFEIFRFSPKAGIADRTVPSASPVYLTFEKSGNAKNINDWLYTLHEPGENHIFYRIPEKAIVYVNWKGEVLASKQILVSQFGAIVSCPFGSVRKGK